MSWIGLILFDNYLSVPNRSLLSNKLQISCNYLILYKEADPLRNSKSNENFFSDAPNASVGTKHL